MRYYSPIVMSRLILASQSPRRKELLRQAGFSFTVCPSHVPEVPAPGETASDYVMRLAREKAQAVSASEPGAVVLGADTTVVRNNQILEKPTDAEDAKRMLRILSSGEHQVLTGICLTGNGRTLTAVSSTRVWFLPLSEKEIGDYVATGEPMDKAGAYAIQGYASRFVEKIEGCHFNIVGLPVSLVYQKLREFEGLL